MATEAVYGLTTGLPTPRAAVDPRHSAATGRAFGNHRMDQKVKRL